MESVCSYNDYLCLATVSFIVGLSCENIMSKGFTVHGIIASNAIMLIDKVYKFLSQLPRPVSETINEDIL